MTGTNNSDSYREEFKQAFLDWATENPDPALIDDMPEHLQAYKDLLSMEDIRAAIHELKPINKTVSTFQRVTLAQQVFGGEFKPPTQAVQMVTSTLDEIESAGGIELPDHVRELENHLDREDEDNPDLQP